MDIQKSKRKSLKAMILVKVKSKTDHYEDKAMNTMGLEPRD